MRNIQKRGYGLPVNGSYDDPKIDYDWYKIYMSETTIAESLSVRVASLGLEWNCKTVTYEFESDWCK